MISEELKLAESWDSYVSWSKEGKYFVFGHSFGLYKYDVYDRRLDTILQDNDKIELIAPSLSPTDSLIAMEGYCSTTYRQTCVWLIDLAYSGLISLPGVDFNPGKELYHCGPQWTADGRNVVSVFGPDAEKQTSTEIRYTNIYSHQSIKIADRVCVEFVLLDTMVYYARWERIDGGTERPNTIYSIYENSISGSQERLLVEDFEYVFDVAMTGDKPLVYFSRNDSLYTWHDGNTTSLGIRGKNPQVLNNVLLYEVYDEKEGVEYDVDDEATYADNIIWMVEID